MSKEREDISPAVWALVQAINAEIHDGDGAAYDADIEEAERINAAIEGAGFVVVPREPTIAMMNVAVDATGAGSDMSWSNLSPQGLFERGYKAMINAYSPKPSGVEAPPPTQSEEP